MHILLGTNNEGKVIEIREALSGLEIILQTPEDLSITETPQETRNTFQENAAQKAQFFFDRTGIPTLADDSGIVIESLQDELGVHTRRWGAGPAASDEEWIAYFLKRMKEEQNKRASFLCHLAFIDKNGRLHAFEGRCDGMITDTLEADYLPGLPISACFKPEGYNKVFSALSLKEKNETSHRGRAIEAFRSFLGKDLTHHSE